MYPYSPVVTEIIWTWSGMFSCFGFLLPHFKSNGIFYWIFFIKFSFLWVKQNVSSKLDALRRRYSDDIRSGSYVVGSSADAHERFEVTFLRLTIFIHIRLIKWFKHEMILMQHWMCTSVFHSWSRYLSFLCWSSIR